MVELVVMDKKNNVSEGTKKKLRNLKPFKKGFDPLRNLNGRPKGSVSIVEGIRQKLEDVDPKSKKVWLDSFLDKLFEKAVKEGNEQLMRDMINRVDGMPKQSTDITSGGDKIEPVLVKFLNNESNRDTK